MVFYLRLSAFICGKTIGNLPARASQSRRAGTSQSSAGRQVGNKKRPFPSVYLLTARFPAICTTKNRILKIFLKISRKQRSYEQKHRHLALGTREYGGHLKLPGEESGIPGLPDLSGAETDSDPGYWILAPGSRLPAPGPRPHPRPAVQCVLVPVHRGSAFTRSCSPQRH